MGTRKRYIRELCSWNVVPQSTGRDVIQKDIFKETARVMQLNKFQWIQAKCFTVWLLCRMFSIYSQNKLAAAILSPQARVNQTAFQLQISNLHTTVGFAWFPPFQVKIAIPCLLWFFLQPYLVNQELFTVYICSQQ